MELKFTSGLSNLDQVLGGIMPGDNIVFQVDSIEDYIPFVTPFCHACAAEGKQLVYFRFAQHGPVIPPDVKADIYTLHPENGFEAFIDEIFDVIEKVGKGGCYVFDLLSELAVDWYSDRMLGNFFMLTCPNLFDWDTVTYFALLKHYHSSHATFSIHNTAQVVIDVYRSNEKVYIHPQKVWKRSSPTMYMLHLWEGERFKPVTMSTAVTEILSRVPQPWLDFSTQRMGIWPRTFAQAQETIESVRLGKRPTHEVDFFFHKLLRMAVTREPGLLQLAEKYLELTDIINIQKRMIGTGLIGGKSAGMLLARAILMRADKSWRHALEEHDSFYIGSDVFYTYLVENGVWWVRRNQRNPATLLNGAEAAQGKIMLGKFPAYIVDQFREMLDYFGQSPIIVRSSSLLEDNYGNSFSGKYESVFCANHGSPQERLENFMNAVRTVYASTMSHEALTYRAHRGLLDKDEQMALLVQRVSGAFYEGLFFPQIAGVGFSFNPYAWNADIDPKAGMLRLVFGLGTRAVDRSDDDYTRIVALNKPMLRPESSFSEMRKYTQRRVDVLDIENNRHTSCDFQTAAQAAPDLPIGIFATTDEELVRYSAEHGRTGAFSWVVTFDQLLSATTFVQRMHDMLRTLAEAYGVPVDVEFTANFLDDQNYRINLVQCRPFQVRAVNRPVSAPPDLTPDQKLLETLGPVIGNGRACDIDLLIYVVPSVYGGMSMADRHAVARMVGKLTHREHDDAGTIMLVGPGRWGTSQPSLGVPVTYAEINTVSIICELALMHEGLIPDVSLGTHFFNDLVEADMVYLAVYPKRQGYSYNERLLASLPNHLTEIFPEAAQLADVVHVFDRTRAPDLPLISFNVDSMVQKGVCYINAVS